MANAQPRISQSVFSYLEELAANNNPDWFNLHKERYLHELKVMEDFADGLLKQLNTHDEIETPSGKKSLRRIYRDTRFSTDKTRYKNYWAGGFSRVTKYRRGGYYFHIEPGNSYVLGGFRGPNPQDLKLIRMEIAYDAQPLREILSSPSFSANFGSLQGEQLGTNPKGFDDHGEAADLLRYKQFLLIRKFTDAEVMDENFLNTANQTFKAMRPFFDYMSNILTVDINGVQL